MKVLVTGSSGFIGTNLMKLLGDRGVPFDLKQGQDTRSYGDITAALQGVDAVVHLAAVTGVEQSVLHPVSTIDNVYSVQTLLDGCRVSGARFLLASTAGALTGQPRSPYAASKLACEAYCHAYAWSYNMATTVLRFSNVYGPWSAHKQTAIPALMRAALSGKPFEVFGDGNQKRDYIYVGDLCRGIVQALEAGAEGPFILASGRLSKLNTLLGLFTVVTGHEVKVVHKAARQGEAAVEHAPSIKAANEEFGFDPTTKLADGLKQTWEWFSTQAAARPSPA